MQIISKPITLSQLKKIAERKFGNIVKAVVDIKKGLMVVGGELHADEEKLLLENGSRQADLWGINLYPDLQGDDWIEYDSMINLRPAHNNLTRGVDDPKIRSKIKNILSRLVKR